MSRPRPRLIDGQTGRGRWIPGATRLRLDPDRVGQKCVAGKECFPTYEAAYAAAENMMARGQVEAGCHQTPHQCRDCRYFHVFSRRIVFLD